MFLILSYCILTVPYSGVPAQVPLFYLEVQRWLTARLDFIDSKYGPLIWALTCVFLV